jgi:hypothetical protein
MPANMYMVSRHFQMMTTTSPNLHRADQHCGDRLRRAATRIPRPACRKAALTGTTDACCHKSEHTINTSIVSTHRLLFQSWTQVSFTLHQSVYIYQYASLPWDNRRLPSSHNICRERQHDLITPEKRHRLQSGLYSTENGMDRYRWDQSMARISATASPKIGLEEPQWRVALQEYY